MEISPVDIDDALVIEEDDISDDEDDDNEDVSVPSFFSCLYIIFHDYFFPLTT